MKGIIYIGGYGRSGSTLLSVILGSASAIFSAGELNRLYWARENEIPCGCGNLLDECDVWSRVLAGNVDIGAVQILRKLSMMQGEEWIVDASKTAYANALRPSIYLKNKYDFRMIHLVRNPKDVVESAKKGKNSDLEKGVKTVRNFEEARTIFGWLFANLCCLIYAIMLRDRYVKIYFEDLVSSPTSTLKNIEEKLGLDLSRPIDLISRGEVFEPGHEVAGNRMLRSGSFSVRGKASDSSFALTSPYRLLCWLGGYARR